MVELLRCILILLHILENMHVDERCYEIFIFLVRLKSIRLDLQTHCCNKKKKSNNEHIENGRLADSEGENQISQTNSGFISLFVCRLIFF